MDGYQEAGVIAFFMLMGQIIETRTAEGARTEFTVLVTVEDHAHMLEFDDVARSLAAHDLNCVLIGQEVAALDRVVGVRLPGVALA